MRGRWRGGSEGFEAFDFFVGFGEELLETGAAVVDLGGSAAGGFFDVGEEGLNFGRDGAEVEGVAGRGGGVG